jgi:hypothetical protein
MVVRGKCHIPAALPWRKNHGIWGWVDSGAGLDIWKKIEIPCPWDWTLRAPILLHCYTGNIFLVSHQGRCKGKAIPGQALRVPQGQGSKISWQLAHEGCKVVSPMHCPPLPPENTPGTHFC